LRRRVKETMQTATRITDQLLNASSERPAEVESLCGDYRVGVRLADWDRLGCLLDGLEMRHCRGEPLPIDPARAAARISYLGETLEIIEIEEAEGRAVLRSNPPRTEEARISFFEMVLDRGEGLSLTRYVYDRQRSERSPVPASITRETLERLLQDLNALVQNV
jgi:hypothetical protein